MREHDVDVEGPLGAPSQRDDHREVPSAREVGHGIEAGRPDALGSQALLRLQRWAGNSGVSSLITQRAASDDAGHDHDHDHEDEARSPVADVVAGGGRPLDSGLRSSMERSMGQDFGDVRIHDDAQAAASARSVQAQAYTVGNHVVFGEGRFRPETADGRHTLAHELTHVVQQRQGPVDGTPAPGGIRISDPSDRFEREAESVAERVVGGAAPEPAPAASGPAVQRREDEGAAEAPPVQRQEEDEAEEQPVQRQAEDEVEEQPPAGAAPAAEQAPVEEGAEPAPPSEGEAERTPEEEEV